MSCNESKGPVRKTQLENGTCADSTADVSVLAEYFRRHHSKAYYLYGRLNVPRRARRHYYPHSLLPAPPLATPKLPLRAHYHSSFPYRVTLPIPINSILHNETDPVTDLIRKKQEWFLAVRDNMRTLRHLKSSTIEKLNDEVVYVPRQSVEAAIRLSRDPEPLFNSHYNWFYAGHGNLHVLGLAGEYYVIHASFNCLYLSELDLKNQRIGKNLFTFESKQHILETIISKDLFIAVRTKTSVALLKINMSDEVTVTKIEEFACDSCVTGIEFDEFQSDILYVSSVDNVLRIINVGSLKCKTVRSPVTESVDNWNRVVSYERNVYARADSNSVRLFDKRNGQSVKEISVPAEDGGAARCEKLSAVQRRVGEGLWAATSHQLIELDVRAGKVKSRRVHHAVSPPILLASDPDAALLALCSQWPADSRILATDTDTNSGALPRALPTAEHALNSARRHLLVDALSRPERHLHAAVTGNAILPREDSFLVFTQNSLGDIFCNELLPSYFDDDEDERRRLLRFAEWTSNQRDTVKVYEVSAAVDASNVWRRLKKLPDDLVIGNAKLLRGEEEKYSDREVVETFERNELDAGLLDLWLDEANPPPTDRDSLMIDFQFSDDD